MISNYYNARNSGRYFLALGYDCQLHFNIKGVGHVKLVCRSQRRPSSNC